MMWKLRNTRLVRYYLDLQNAQTLRSLSAGDLVKFPRGIYSHWAVYIGKGQVVHVTGCGGLTRVFRIDTVRSWCGYESQKAEVCKHDIWKVARGTRVLICNDRSGRWKAYPNEAIVRRAMDMIGTKGYNIFTFNCEHFANWCRYGRLRSRQVERLITIGMFSSVTFRCGLFLVGVAIAMHGYRNREKLQLNTLIP